MKSLFGYEIPDVDPVKTEESSYQRWKRQNYYHKADKGGYRCKNCKHICKVEMANTYYKCRLLGVSGSAATDICVGHVCNLFEERSECK